MEQKSWISYLPFPYFGAVIVSCSEFPEDSGNASGLESVANEDRTAGGVSL